MEQPGFNSQASAIEIHKLTKSFGARLVLKGIDFKVATGESVVIFGPNGAGKTTLLKVLATVINPSSGEVIIDGLSIKKNAEEIRRKIGIVTHQTFLYDNLTTFENLDFYGRMYDVPQRKERIKETLDMVGMMHRLNDRVGTLSRGMQQRVSIARALLHKPSVILLDEPETGLDQKASSMLKEALWKERELERTIIHTTHSMERAIENCDRILIMVHGEITYEKRGQGINIADLRQAYQRCVEIKT